jgi:cyclophilin family peptidyl-prolyl cis-trans isomerase
MEVNLNRNVVLGLFFILSMVICKSQAGLYTVTQKVAFNMTINDLPAGRIVFGMFGQTAPKTVQNFVTLAAGTMGFGYTGSTFHRIIKGFMCQGGDFTTGDGRGGRSIYGDTFPDENFNITHRPGFVNMANAGPDTNGSQFSILVTIADWLNGHHCVFAKVLEGMDVVYKMNNLPTNGADRPLSTPMIASCEVIAVPVPFDITP